MLSPCVCLSVCLSVYLSVCPFVRLSLISRYCIEMTGRIELVLAWERPSTYHTACYVISKFGDLQNKGIGTLLWNFVPNSRRGKFRHGKSIVLSTKRSSLLTTLTTFNQGRRFPPNLVGSHSPSPFFTHFSTILTFLPLISPKIQLGSMGTTVSGLGLSISR